MNISDDEIYECESSSNINYQKPKNFPFDFKNPMITRFNSSSHFIYDIFESSIYFQQVKDKNRIKLTLKELTFFQDMIHRMKTDEEIKSGCEFIKVNSELANDLNNFFKAPKYTGLLESFLINELSDQSNRVNCTCRKLAKKFKTQYNQQISKSTVHNKLKKVLGLRWRKTTIKTKKVKNIKNVISMMTFIKIIIKCLTLNFNVIYCDESCIQTINNHLKIWRKKEENFIVDISPKKKFNLLMAIFQKGVLHFKLNKDSTNENNFLEYMKELINVIKEKKIFPYVLILDNYSAHKTKQLYEFYIENKVNVVFNAPYASNFNAIEYSFRELKRILYSRIYKAENELIDDVKNILNSEWIKNKIYLNIFEAFKNYLMFYNEEKEINFNSFDS